MDRRPLWPDDDTLRRAVPPGRGANRLSAAGPLVWSTRSVVRGGHPNQFLRGPVRRDGNHAAFFMVAAFMESVSSCVPLCRRAPCNCSASNRVRGAFLGPRYPDSRRTCCSWPGLVVTTDFGGWRLALWRVLCAAFQPAFLSQPVVHAQRSDDDGCRLLRYGQRCSPPVRV